MRFLALSTLLTALGLAACAGNTPPPDHAAVLKAPSCGREVYGGFRVPPDGVEDLALAQDVRMGERWFKMRVWSVPRAASQVRGYYKICMNLEADSAGEDGSHHYTKGESTLSISGDKRGAMVRIRFAAQK